MLTTGQNGRNFDRRVNLGGNQLIAAFPASAGQDFAPIFCAHPLAKPCSHFSPFFAGLIGSFHDDYLPYIVI
jgi:hypothetical protein